MKPKSLTAIHRSAKYPTFFFEDTKIYINRLAALKRN